LCARDDEESPRSAGCLCHTPAFARLNTHLSQKFSRHSSLVAMGATLGAFAAGSGGTAAGAPAAPISRVAFTNARLFDGKSDTLLHGLRVVVDGAMIEAVEPAEAPLDSDAGIIDCGGRVLMPGLIDAHWHAMLAALPLTVLLTADVGYISLVAADEARKTLMRGFAAYKFAKAFNLKTAWGTDILFDANMTAHQGAILATLERWYRPVEILKMATAVNGELLAMSGPRNPYPGKLGVIEAGALADLILVDGDPIANLKLIGDPDRNFLLIMKDGRIVKDALA
jgi:imidazolonepropionase-like amidohydrolase